MKLKKPAHTLLRTQTGFPTILRWSWKQKFVHHHRKKRVFIVIDNNSLDGLHQGKEMCRGVLDVPSRRWLWWEGMQMWKIPLAQNYEWSVERRRKLRSTSLSLTFNYSKGPFALGLSSVVNSRQTNFLIFDRTRFLSIAGCALSCNFKPKKRSLNSPKNAYFRNFRPFWPILEYKLRIFANFVL